MASVHRSESHSTCRIDLIRHPRMMLWSIWRAKNLLICVGGSPKIPIATVLNFYRTEYPASVLLSACQLVVSDSFASLYQFGEFALLDSRKWLSMLSRMFYKTYKQCLSILSACLVTRFSLRERNAIAPVHFMKRTLAWFSRYISRSRPGNATHSWSISSNISSGIIRSQHREIEASSADNGIVIADTTRFCGIEFL